MSKDGDVQEQAKSERPPRPTWIRVLTIVGSIVGLFLLYWLVVFVYCALNPLECLDSAARRGLSKQGFVERIVEVEGVPLIVQDSQGEGQAIVFLHGQLLSGTAFARRRFLEPLRDAGYRVLLLDLPGHGQSGRPEPPVTLGKLVRLVEGVLEAEKLEMPILVGHGLGGWLAALVARGDPGRVRKLVLIEPDGIAPPGPDDLPRLPDSRKQWRQVFRQANPKERGRPVSDSFIDALLERGRESGLRDVYDHVTPEDYLRGRGAHIQTSTAVLWGEENQYRPAANGRALTTEIMGARFRVVPKAGYGPFVQAPGATAKILLEVLKALESSDPASPAVEATPAPPVTPATSAVPAGEPSPQP